jgi:transcription-repair coupling factor (superfamily II helicase)
VDLFGDLMESIRRFDVESQRSISKVEDALLLPLTEYQKSRALLVELAELMQESGVPARDLPPPGEPFPGWELLVPMVRPRRHSVFSLLDRPLILWDEPAAGARRRRAPVEAARTNTCLAGLRSRQRFSSTGRIWRAKRPAFHTSRWKSLK